MNCDTPSLAISFWHNELSTFSHAHAYSLTHSLTHSRVNKEKYKNAFSLLQVFVGPHPSRNAATPPPASLFASLAPTSKQSRVAADSKPSGMDPTPAVVRVQGGRSPNQNPIDTVVYPACSM